MRPSLIPACMASMVLAGCAAADIQRIGAGDAGAAYELQGHTLVHLRGQAERLCPKGYEMLRQWERVERPEYADHFIGRWLFMAGDYLGTNDRGRAQAIVQCKG